MNQFMSAIIGGLVIAGTLSLIALGLVLIYRATDTFNFAHGQFMLLPAFLVGRWQTDTAMPFVVIFLLAIAITAAMGAALYKAVLQRTVGLPPFMPIIATLGFASMADGVLGIIFGSSTYTITIPGMPTGVVEIFSVRVRSQTVALTLLSFALAGIVAAYMQYTESGARIRAAGQNAILASQGGINVSRTYLGSWIGASVLAALAGITYGSTNIVAPTIVGLALLTFPAILLGGADSIFGALVGSIVVGLVQGFTAAYWGGNLVNVTTYLLLLVVLLWRPQGLFGTSIVSKL
jgi:branched-chain amino acid transport system permease protein